MQNRSAPEAANSNAAAFIEENGSVADTLQNTTAHQATQSSVDKSSPTLESSPKKSKQEPPKVSASNPTFFSKESLSIEAAKLNSTESSSLDDPETSVINISRSNYGSKSLASDDSKSTNIDSKKIFDVVSKYEEVLEANGYTQLIHKPIAESFINKEKHIAPTDGNGNLVNGVATPELTKQNNIYSKLSARLFASKTSNSLKALVMSYIFKHTENELNDVIIKEQLSDAKVFKDISNQVCVALMVLIRNQEGVLEVQLRIIPNSTNGHSALVLTNEEGGDKPACLIGAGEIYILNGKIIMVNNKSGAYNQILKEKEIFQNELFDLLLKDYYSDEYKKNCFVLASEKDEDVVLEAMKRGFPLSLFKPMSILDKVPLDTLPADLRQKVIENDLKYKETVASAEAQAKLNKDVIVPPKQSDKSEIVVTPGDKSEVVLTALEPKPTSSSADPKINPVIKFNSSGV